MRQGLTILALVFTTAAATALLLSYFDRDTEPEAVEIAEDIRARACGGDVPGFFSYIDEDSLGISLKRTELRRVRGQYVFSKKKKPPGRADVRKYILKTVPELLDYKLKMYEDQVEAGESGPICNMEIVRAGGPAKTVKLKLPGGVRTMWEFGKIGEDWKLVSITDVKPISLASVKEYNKKEAKKNKSANKNPDGIAKSLENLKTIKTQDLKSPEPEIIANTKDITAEILKSTEVRPSEKPDDVTLDTKPGEPDEAQRSKFLRDFRNTAWGMSPSEVRKSETQEPVSVSPGVLNYSTYYSGERVNLSYKFSKDKLKSAGILFLSEHPEEIFYVQDYEKRKSELSALFGPPVLAEQIWYNRLYENDPESFGFAVAIGHLRLRTKWKTERTEILLELKSEDYEMSLVQSYHSR